MAASKWLLEKLKNEYGQKKADAVYAAILNSREIQFSSPEAEEKFTAILAEWNRREEAEMPDEDQDAGGYESGRRIPQSGDPLAEYRRITSLSLAERAMYTNNPQK